MALRESYLDGSFNPQAKNFQLPVATPEQPISQPSAQTTQQLPKSEGLMGWLERNVVRGGGLRPGRDNDKINAFTNMIATGALPDEQVMELRQKNPASDAIFAQAQFANRQRQQVQQIMKNYANDMPGMVTALRNTGNYELAQKIETQRIAQEREARMEKDLKETPFVKELRAAGIQQGSPEWNKLIRAHLAKMDAPTATQLKISSGAQGPLSTPSFDFNEFYKKQRPQDQMALDLQSWNYINKGTLPYRKGTGGGADRNDIVIRNSARIATELGMTPEELSAKSADYKANAQSLAFSTKKLDSIQGTLGSFHNNVETWNNIAQGLAPKLGGKEAQEMSSLLSKIDFVGIQSLDDIKLRIQQQTNDPTAAAYLTATMAVATDYARIMQGPQSVASLTEGARQDAQRLLKAGMNDRARKSVIGTLYSDTEGQIKGLQDQVGKIRKRMGFSIDKETEKTSAPATSSGIPAGWTVNVK